MPEEVAKGLVQYCFHSKMDLQDDGIDEGCEVTRISSVEIYGVYPEKNHGHIRRLLILMIIICSFRFKGAAERKSKHKTLARERRCIK